MKKYSEFISSSTVNEGFFKNLFGRIGSFLSGAKSKIQERIDKMVQIEKDFIDKSDDLNYDIFYSDSKKSNDPVIANNARQKSMMSRRALETMRIAKNSEMNLLIKEIQEICGNDTNLINFYQKKKIVADSDLAQYAYEKAKKFRDREYENVFYNQWKTLDDEAKKYRQEVDVFPNQYNAPSDLDYGMFDLPLKEFISQITGLPKSDIGQLLDDASAIKFQMEEDYRKENMELKDLRSRSYKRGDINTLQIAKNRYEELKNEHKKNIVSINNKISALKNRLKNI